MNTLFQNALGSVAQPTPPIWFMRQAGRYHSHYQGLRAQHSFEDLCRVPELAAEVALGPVKEFDFDVSILFSDLLFPLDALGMGLSYTDHGPQLERKISTGFKIPTEVNSAFIEESLQDLKFQSRALQLTREILPKNKSLIGFVGGLWTLFVYACEGGHAGSLIHSKNFFFKEKDFIHALDLLMQQNIKLQIDAGAEVVMIFDTAAGEVSSLFFKQNIQPYLLKWCRMFPGKLGYYSKGTLVDFFDQEFVQAPWAGRGFDHRWDLTKVLKSRQSKGFIQGNFDQAMLFQDTEIFQKSVTEYLTQFQNLSVEERAGWVSGLGHGVLPKTPEKHVHLFIEKVRKTFA